MATSTISVPGENVGDSMLDIMREKVAEFTAEASTGLYAAVFVGAPATAEFVQIDLDLNLSNSQTYIATISASIIDKRDKGLALTSMELSLDPANNTGYFLGVFTPGILVNGNSAYLTFGDDEASFMARFAGFASQGVRLLDFGVGPGCEGNIA